MTLDVEFHGFELDTGDEISLHAAEGIRRIEVVNSLGTDEDVSADDGPEDGFQK